MHGAEREVGRNEDAEIGALRKDVRTRLRLCASLTIAEWLLPAWLVSFRAAARSVGREDVEIILTAANNAGVELGTARRRLERRLDERAPERVL